MRRIVIAFASTISALVLLFSWPTSTNRPLTAAGAPAAGATGPSSGVAGGLAAGAGPGGSAGAGSGSGSGSSTGTGGSSSPAATGPAAATTTATFDGDPAGTRYGAVQVRITVTDGVVTGAEAIQHPSGGHNQQINDYAVPILTQETVQAQSAQIDMVSGATVTSTGYVASLQSALDKAGL